MSSLTTEKGRTEAVAILLKDMEVTASNMRSLIVSMPPKDLLGYIYAQYIMKMLASNDTTSVESDSDNPNDTTYENQFLLEYVHAVLASDTAPNEVKFGEEQCGELFELSRKLQEQAMRFAIASSAGTENTDFGPDTADIEYHAKSTWIMLRGNRYQVLEGEFYRYVLAPHDDILKDVYGIGANEIAEGFQDMANATRSGQANAIEEMMKQFEAVKGLAAKKKKPFKDIVKAWVTANTDQSDAVRLAIDDMFRGGITNVSRHTKLPPKLLADLAYQRGEETEFFAEGDFAGTPYRTLPARKKPLIQLGSDYYAIDLSFTRDAGYRALLFNLLQRKPKYKEAFNDRQKIMSEDAFPDILTNQLPGATIYQEVYYKDPATRQWSENDTLVLIDDVLYLVEAKAGAAATIASPEFDFKRHAQSVQDLVLKAYTQCERFFNYLNSADEVPLYHRVAGNYVESGRVRRSDYRVMVPIGLTVESFSPFSTFCKDLPQIKPLLGKHNFVSMSIDDLFVLKRILPTPGIFAHYMEVRQAMAGIKHAHLYDEFDHLGAYITKNRFDQDIADQLKDSDLNLVIWDGMSDIIDSCFMGENWESNPIPTQDFPDEVSKLLGALDTTRTPGWLSAESFIRNFGEQARNNLAKALSDLDKTIEQHPARYFVFALESQPLFIWMQNSVHDIEWEKINNKASAIALCIKSPDVFGVLVVVSKGGIYNKAQHFKVDVPSERTEENAHVFDDAKLMSQRTITTYPSHRKDKTEPRHTKKIGRNEPCPCGSGKKYKRCHGR
ncbi:MAG: SEC-C metal-binding domain-containing protein [Candidatus Thiodiazotropha sp.]